VTVFRAPEFTAPIFAEARAKLETLPGPDWLRVAVALLARSGIAANVIHRWAADQDRDFGLALDADILERIVRRGIALGATDLGRAA
jgi:hypothetical protein